MKRDLNALSSRTFDLLIVGGGATGACVARDAALRGLSVALVEMGDFCSATSAGSSKMMHGGLRYLRTGEVGLVRESLRERRIWLRIAPHLVWPRRFLLPAYSRREEFETRLGLAAYDALSWDRNRGVPSTRRSNASLWLSAEEAREVEPIIDRPGLRGATTYADAQMLPERIVIECLDDAATHGAVVANYTRATAFERHGDSVHTIRVSDELSSASFTVSARTIVNATGPWADLVLPAILGAPSTHRLARSKGIHLVVRPLTQMHALTLSHRGGHFFILPWDKYSLIGTTDVPFERDPDQVTVTSEDVDGLLETVNATLPAARLTTADVRYAYAALRPLIAASTPDTYHTSRRGEVVDHARSGGPTNVISALGGKWTTSRATAERCVDLIERKLQRRYLPCTTSVTALPNAHLPTSPAQLESYTEDIHRAFRNEMAMTVEDVALRRFWMPDADDAILADIAKIGSSYRGWDGEEQRRQITSARAQLRRHFAR